MKRIDELKIIIPALRKEIEQKVSSMVYGRDQEKSLGDLSYIETIKTKLNDLEEAVKEYNSLTTK